MERGCRERQIWIDRGICRERKIWKDDGMVREGEIEMWGRDGGRDWYKSRGRERRDIMRV